QKIEFEKLKKEVDERPAREGLPDLPGAKKGKVVMRFAPSPSGAFHIGHALTSSISYLFVKKYGGKFYVRIEDTNPDNIYPKAYDLIKKDSEWLFEGKAVIAIQSNRMELYYKYAEKLLKIGHAYVCTCSGDEFRKCVKFQKDCPCRNFNIKENLERWEMMFDSSYKPGDAVLRFKSNMKHKNPAMRDFPLMRINEIPHPLQKKKYRVWPLMNLAVTVDDIEMKMTHVIRAKEHRDNAERQKMIFDVLGKKFPWVGFLGRWHIKGLRLSASQITKDIEAGKYSGWDDPKLPTIQALIKKGYKPQAFWKFAERIGLSESDKTIDKKEFFTLLDNFNK
ncbi:MAG: glutamate--tRNA ligase, partial [Nanoarchaeota archaeon]|nr:glutamate--tRNA ligase [Nanoarchaeota archaeon]